MKSGENFGLQKHPKATSLSLEGREKVREFWLQNCENYGPGSATKQASFKSTYAIFQVHRLEW